MSEKGRTTVSISKEAGEKLRQICFYRRQTKVAFFEELIEKAYQEIMKEEGKRRQPAEVRA